VDFDLKVQTMRVRGDPERENKGKTRLSATVIPLTQHTIDEVGRYRDHLLRTTGLPPKGRMWVHNGQPIMADFGKSLASHAEAAGIKRYFMEIRDGVLTNVPRAVNPYIFRSSFATIAWLLDIQQSVARIISRHVDTKMLDEIYCRPRPADVVAKLKLFVVPPHVPSEGLSTSQGSQVG
jgi:hypothetical protein